MGTLIERSQNWWKDADSTRRILTVLGALAIVGLIVGTVLLASRPKMVPLYRGLELTDQAMVVEELQGKGFRVETDLRGNVLVPEKDLANARMQLTLSKKLPASNRDSLDLLQMGATVTQAQERERLKMARQAEIESSIMTMDSVGSARVLLTYGERSAFARESQPATASVQIIERQDGAVSQEAAKSIVLLVQNAVSGLEPENITIVTGTGRILFDGSENGTSSATATRKVEAQIAEARRREREYQSILDRAFGPGNTIAKVDVEMDFDEVSETYSSLTPTEDPIARVRSTEEMQGEGANNGGIAGLLGNTGEGIIAGAPASSGGGSNYSSNQTQEEFGQERIVRDTRRAPGTVTALAVSVLVNTDVIENVAPIERFVQSSLGLPTGDRNFTSEVIPASFDTTASEAAAAAMAADASRKQMQQIISLLPIIALIIVAVLLTKSLGKVAGQRRAPSSLPPGAIALPDGGYILRDGTRAFKMPDGGYSATPEGDEPLAIDLSGVPIAMNAPAPEPVSVPALEGATDPMGGGVATLEGVKKPREVEVGEIEQRINVPLEQIKKMAADKPAAIALLLKGWISEDRP